MAKEKAAPKKDDRVELHIPEEVYNSYKANFPTDGEWNDQIRLLFHIEPGDETCRSMKYCKIKIKKKVTEKSDDDSSDEGFFPLKLCDEGP
jgi:hypothetical protein